MDEKKSLDSSSSSSSSSSCASDADEESIFYCLNGGQKNDNDDDDVDLAERVVKQNETMLEKDMPNKTTDYPKHIADIMRSIGQIGAPILHLPEIVKNQPILLQRKSTLDANANKVTGESTVSWMKKLNFTLMKDLFERKDSNTDKQQQQHINKLSVSSDDLKKIIKKDRTTNLIVLLDQETYWLENTMAQFHIHRTAIPQMGGSLLNIDQAAKVYRNEFVGNLHWNFVGRSADQTKCILSLVLENGDEQHRYRTVLRTAHKMIHGVIDTHKYAQPMCIQEIFQATMPGLQIEYYKQLIDDEVSFSELAKYDEQAITSTFKFGVLYQKSDQVTENEMYNNRELSEQYRRFLDSMALEVELKDYEGYNGGLDTKYGLTGQKSYAYKFEGNEIMFHVSTLLPFNENDPQQIERKRHIGNDIVALVLQEPGAKFCPNVIESQFLQVFVCIQPSEQEGETRYQVQVTARSDVSRFGPYLLHSYSLSDERFKRLFYSKLINAQIAACNYSGKIGGILKRRREMFFEHVLEKLLAHTDEQQ